MAEQVDPAPALNLDLGGRVRDRGYELGELEPWLRGGGEARLETVLDEATRRSRRRNDAPRARRRRRIAEMLAKRFCGTGVVSA